VGRYMFLHVLIAHSSVLNNFVPQHGRINSSRGRFEKFFCTFYEDFS
jgi:hypothetical protein